MLQSPDNDVSILKVLVLEVTLDEVDERGEKLVLDPRYVWDGLRQ